MPEQKKISGSLKKVPVYSTAGEQVREIELDASIFGITVNPELVAQAVIAQQANRRIVRAHTKGRGEVAGGGRKPWRQKGTGRARHGSIRSPLWQGGGVTFGPTKNRNFSQKINKKAKRKALFMTLSDKAANDRVILLEALEVSEAKTKMFFEILQHLKLRSDKAKDTKQTKTKAKKDEDVKKFHQRPRRVLIVLPAQDEKVFRAARNIPQAEVISASSLNVLAVIKAYYLVMPVSALPVIKKTFTSSV